MLQLYVWSPALDAPSIDPGSTAIMAYLQLIGASFNVVESNDPNISPTGELPLLKDGPAWIGGANRILAHLAKKGMDGNENLTPEQKAQYFAYASLVEDKLYDCMLFTWYADTTNFVKTIRPTYAKLLPFPTRYIVPSQLRKAAKFRLEEYGVEVTEDDAVVSQATEERKFLLETWHKTHNTRLPCLRASLPTHLQIDPSPPPPHDPGDGLPKPPPAHGPHAQTLLRHPAHTRRGLVQFAFALGRPVARSRWVVPRRKGRNPRRDRSEHEREVAQERAADRF
ncbi:outer mitochondrial membrane transport complex protein-domain-containing protein [Jimgerdemannia flammicorona]|uniref:Outer mitochondrial membrane transport complex protein-domain-containing protein n=1 Tax=Jimgerdemannia flammicorona TaxID=994334 RepID=A0A433D0E6_9FUNG|nr:outer mitochondrial membrane transport complex protein-domain-containing protein [Jimgerdemannia flammicorona]